MTGDPCAFVLSYGSRFEEPEPDETCPNEAEPGSDFCPEHEEE